MKTIKIHEHTSSTTLIPAVNNMLRCYGINRSGDWEAIAEKLKTTVCDLSAEALARYSVLELSEVEQMLNGSQDECFTQDELRELRLIRGRLIYDEIGEVLEQATKRLDELDY